ncbi:hypothetical protein ACEQ8H_004418 [Pleosporales sp. CAS-2024a]
MSQDDSTKPLLVTAIAAGENEPQSANNSPMQASSHVTRHRVWPLIALLVLVHLSAVLYTLPLNRVVESRLCQEHYKRSDPSAIAPDGSIPEKLCKTDDVQGQLAWTQGVMETTLVICDFIVTIPFSFAAERYGFKVVLWANLIPRIGMSIWALIVGHLDHVLPTNAILAGPFLAVFGGECVFQSTIFTLTSAFSNEYIQRASYFSYISSTSYVVSFLGPSLAASTMSISLWLPFWINILLLSCAIPVISRLPSMRRTAKLRCLASDESVYGTRAEEAESLLEEHDEFPNLLSNAFERHTSIWQTMLSAIKTLQRLVAGRRNFQVLLVSFWLTALASSDTKLLVQYISKRYEWTFAQAGYMLSAKAIVNFVLLALVVPRLIQFSMTTKAVHGSEVRLNCMGAQISILFSVVGVLCVAMAWHFWQLLAALVVYALGSALPVFTMSLVKSPLIAVASSHVQDFSIVMLTKTLGSLVGAPLMTVLWIQAIRLGGAGIGLPYFASAVSPQVTALMDDS